MIMPVIQCPYCRTSLTEASTACPSCQLDLERANKVMGPIPLLSGTGLTVLTQALDGAGERPMIRRIQAFHRRFPQCRVNVLVARFPEAFPPASYLFWLFNSGGLSEAGHIRGKNRDILIGIDPFLQTAGLIVGYGLEPFLAQDALDQILAEAIPLLQAGNLSGGVVEIIESLSRLMEDVCRELPAMLGLEKELAVENAGGDF
jgi:uncharacterized membrane protein YgcG